MLSELALEFVQSWHLSFDKSNTEVHSPERIWSKSGPLWLEKARA